MKKTLSCALCIILVICLLFSVAVTFNATSYSLESPKGYETQLLYENSGVYFCSQGENELVVNKLNSNTKYTYSFNEQIFAYTVANNAVYILTADRLQENAFIIYKALGESIKEYRRVINVNLDDSTTFAADRQEIFYINDADNNIVVVNSRASSAINLKGDQLFTHSGNVYSVNANGIMQISNNSVLKSYKYNEGFVKDISENYICSKKYIFSLGNSLKKIKTTESGSNMLTGESDKYIVEGCGNKLYAYNKQNGKLIDEYKINTSPLYLTVFKNIIYVISKNNYGYILNTYNANSIFSETVKVNGNDGNLDFKDYKLHGKYIFVEKGTTVARFKNSISYPGYIAVFSKASGNIGTNNTVTFEKSGKKHTYIFIVLGDLTGEGNANSRDLYAMFGHLLNENQLLSPFTISADLNGDNKISNIDLVMLARMSE